MANNDGGSNAVAIVAIIIIVLIAAAFLYFFFMQGEVKGPGTSSVTVQPTTINVPAPTKK